MAKKQNKKAKPIQQNTQKVKQKTPTVVNPVKTNKEPTKNEIMFFRIGISVIAIGLVVAAIIIIVNYFMGKEDVSPYEDYNHLKTEELVAITKHVDDTTYGDLDFFIGKSKYDDLRVILDKYDVFYFYFYHSSNIEKDILTEIEKLDDVVDSPLFFIDVDKISNKEELFENEDLTHLNLDSSATEMLLIYDMSPDTLEEFFRLETTIASIIDELRNL